jgi:hypothetical protein
MELKSPEDAAELRATLNHFQSLPADQNPLAKTLNATQIVHFARFVFLDHDTKLAVITAYDGTLDAYVNVFIDKVGSVFNLLLKHMADAPPLPVEQFRDEFLAYVKSHDLPVVDPFYSAYPRLTVVDILAMQQLRDEEEQGETPPAGEDAGAAAGVASDPASERVSEVC